MPRLGLRPPLIIGIILHGVASYLTMRTVHLKWELVSSSPWRSGGEDAEYNHRQANPTRTSPEDSCFARRRT